MKIQLTLSAAAAAILLATASYAQAGTPVYALEHPVQTAKVAHVNYNTVDPVIVRSETPVTGKQNARGWVGGEVGNNAPHEERNPSAHPELFQIAR